MKKKLLALVVLVMVLLVGCGAPGDPIVDDLYTQNVLPGTASTYSVGSEDLPYLEGWYDEATVKEELELSGPLTLTGDGLVYIELRPDLDFATVQARGKPVWVTRGIIGGWSFPIYNNDNQELFSSIHIPHRWGEASNILVHILCYLDTANTGKRFNIQLSWEGFTDGDVTPNTSNDLTVETQTGAAPQYKSFHIDFAIDYDIDVGDELLGSDELHFRIRRLDASADEIAGEVIVTHIGVIFKRDKLGSSVP